MKIISLLKKYQRLLIALLIGLEVGLSILLCDQYLKNQSTMQFFEFCISFVIIAVIISLFHKNDELEKSILRKDTIKATSPCANILINLQKNRAELSPMAQDVLNIALEKITVKDLLARLPLNLLRVVEEYIKNPQENLFRSKEGLTHFIDQNLQTRYLNYKLSYASLFDNTFYSIVIWLQDITIAKQTEIELLKYLHQYRAMSYELENILANLPFPVWKRHNNGEIVFYNNSFATLMRDIGLLSDDAKADDIENAIKQLLFDNVETPQGLCNQRRIFTVNNQPVHIDFHESITLDKSIIGYAKDLTEQLQAQKESAKLSVLLQQFMQSSKDAVIILNNQQKVAFFNDNLANFFNISTAFLAKQPSFAQLLDKMREGGCLPETKNFAQYKQNCLQQLRALQSQTNYLYLPNGQMFSEIMIHVEGGNAIIIYSNISSELNLERSYNELLSVYKAILNNNIDPICIYGQDGKLKMYNNNFADSLGKMRHHLKGQPHFSEVIKWQVANIGSHNQNKIDEIYQAIVASIEERESTEIKVAKKDMSAAQAASICIQPLPDNTILVRYGT